MDLGLNNAGDKCHQQLQQQHQPVSKEQLLLERRQRLQGKTQPQANRELNNKVRPPSQFPYKGKRIIEMACPDKTSNIWQDSKIYPYIAKCQSKNIFAKCF
jgi:hypothetical protein